MVKQIIHAIHGIALVLALDRVGRIHCEPPDQANAPTARSVVLAWEGVQSLRNLNRSTPAAHATAKHEHAGDPQTDRAAILTRAGVNRSRRRSCTR